jgi:Asp-tRNA(Asn)/Glu-tRNA(Gln) amidotransferase A subunit family amidase
MPLMLAALDLARRIEAGELSPAAVIALCAEAIAARDADIGAFAACDIDAAREAATERHASAPLRGLPIGIKDIFDTAQLPTAYGSRLYAGHRPKADATLVMLAQRAGGIVLGKTVTTEFASLQPAKTRNPRNMAHTPGGSSSGSAAAVAAGMVPIACGSQTAGSIIRPAAFCGIAGFKPSFRLLPTVGMKCFAWSLDTAGLFAVTIADVAYAAAAISGRDLRIDRHGDGLIDDSPPSIGLVRSHHWPEASADMQDAFERAARLAEAAGARVRDVELPPAFEQADRIHATIQDFEAFRALAYEYDHHRDDMGPLLRQQLDAASTIAPNDYDDARRLARRARQSYADVIAGFDVLLSPSATGAAPHGLLSTGRPIFNRLWTLLGPPCINVPGLTDRAGLPLGVQVIGRFARDRVALEAAAFVERALMRA